MEEKNYEHLDEIQSRIAEAGFNVANIEKLDRAIMGAQTSHGATKGGVGPDADANTILAEYDRLGGLIRKGKTKIKMGSFFDFKAKAPRAKPKPILQVFVNGEVVEYADGADTPIEVKAAMVVADRQASRRAEAEAAKEERLEQGKAAKKKRKAGGADGFDNVDEE